MLVNLSFRRMACLAALALTLLAPGVSLAQGVLIEARNDMAFVLPRLRIMPHPLPRPQPQPQQAYKIKALTINANLADQIAKVQVTQSFVNTGNRQMEVSFVYPLPYDGAVDQLTFMVDGTEYEAKLLSATEARTIYEGYMRRNQDPALMEWMGHGMFKTSVFPVPPGAERSVTLKYTQVVRKTGGLTEFLFPMSTAKYTATPVEKIAINVNIQSQASIKNVYSPTHSVDIQRPSNIQAVVKFEVENETPASDFRLLYDIGDEAVGATVLSYRPLPNEDGYFLMMVSPEVRKSTEEQPRKTVVFVVDRSGSMSGKKMEQAKNALRFVINNLHEGDLFNVIAYDSVVESFQPELQRYNDDTRKRALGWIEGVYAGGSTNIDGALKAALGQLVDNKQPSYVVFLTDGLPTAGETKEQQIVINAAERNKVRARVFSMGVGYDVNSRLLDKLARKLYGQSEYVRPNDDIEEQVARLYERIGAPALSNVDIAYDLEGASVEQGSAVNRVYPRETYDLFAGDQLVVVGRYRKPGAAKVTIAGTVSEAEQSFDFPAELTRHSGDETYAFVEKLWATRRVGEIIDEIDISGKNQELIDELVSLSTKHGILTPYTSFLADDQPQLRPPGEVRALAADAFGALEQNAGGQAGFAQRAEKGAMKRAAQAPAPGAARYRNAQDGSLQVVQNVQNVASKTFFLRDGRWVDSSVTPEQIAKAQKVERFSKEYFDLVDKHGADAAPYLAIEGSVVVQLGDQTYAF
ncbi:VIT and vWA domain-containing protein [Lignipirellula cremea]|uniref:von Willebrand factor type A domain protein n=1 Tax=Lignipirellula cremea TaxID=2528010 RepID=A0A518DPN5_9BACT|nr:VIT domain-containing protein [Lignipirellula cremea]QDU93807.1 von Willebrand factor type A domain protein [Lignipirellula cremea]